MAKIDYNHLLRMDTRSQSAFMGLARVEAHTGQPVRAKDLLAQAVNLSPKDPKIYLERSEIYKEMDMMPEAVDDLVYAVSLDDGHSGAIQKLVAYSNESYNGVIEGLNRNIERSPGRVCFIMCVPPFIKTIMIMHLLCVIGIRSWRRTFSIFIRSIITGPFVCRG